MATSLCRTWISRSVKVFTRGFSFSARRRLLTEAYRCEESWQKRLESPIVQNVSLGELSIQLRERFDKEGRASVIDMDILANKLHDMDILDADYMEDLIRRFRCSPDGVPVQDSIVHTIVRAYIDLDMTDRLLAMMQDRMNYGIFPDNYATSLLLDHFIKGDNYADAAKVAYEKMLQEDFSHQITFLLSLLATTKHLKNSKIADLALQLPEVDPEEEEDWIKVKVIPFPYYDDHFDIKDERFLLGKTLYQLGQEVKDNDLLSNSLKVIGLGLYQKFGKGLLLLSELAGSKKENAVLEEALQIFDECVENAETRDPEAKEKDFGLRTIDDEIYKLRLTPDGREELTTEFEEMAYKLRWQKQVSEDSLLSMVEALVKSELPKHEGADIAAQQQLFSTWEEDRKQLVEAQLKLFMETKRKAEMEQQLKELQEKEELLRFFEKREEILIYKKRAPIIKPPMEEDDEDTLREKRRKRRKYRFQV